MIPKVLEEPRRHASRGNWGEHSATERAAVVADLGQACVVERMVARGDLPRGVVNHFEADGALDLLTLDQTRLSVHRVVERGW